MESISPMESLDGYGIDAARRHEEEKEKVRPGSDAETVDRNSSKVKADELKNSFSASVQQSVYTGKGSFFDTVV